MAVQSFQEAHAQLYSGQSNQPQLANPARGLTLFQQAHNTLIQANENKPQPKKVSTNPVKVQGAKQPQQQPQQSPLDAIRQSPIGGIAKSVISTIKNLPEAHFADKMNMYTPLGFVANLAQGVINTPAEAFKGAVHLGETTKSHTATPQSAAGDIAAEVQLPLLFLTGPEAAPAKTAVQASAKTIIANLAKAGIKESAIGAGFGFLGGLQSGRDINNTTDYLKNLLQNIGIGAGTGLGIGTALHGTGAATKLVGKHVVIPLMQGASHTDGAVFVDHATTNPTIAHLQLPPEKAQAIVLGNEDLSKSSAGKAILKESIVAQDGNGHVAITPTEDGKYTLPDGKKVDISAAPIYDPKTKYDTPDIVSARAEQAKIPSTDKITTPERQQFREDLAQKLYDNGGYAKLADRPLTEIKSNKRADIVTGLPGSGKNTIISEPLIRQHGSVLIDSDEAKKGIPESNGGAYSGATHGESTQVINSVLDKALGKGNNIVMPLIGRNIDKIRQIRDELNARGYEVHLHHNEVSLETSATRAVERYKRSGKFVDPDYIVNEVGLQPNKNYDILKQEKGFKSYEKYNNDVKPGEKPKLFESSSYEADHNSGKNAKSSERSSGTHGSVNSGTSKTKQTEQSGINPRTNSEQSPNKKVLTGNEVRAIRDIMEAKVQHLRETSSNPEEYGKGIDKLVADITERAQGDKPVLSALRTELNKEMYGMVGENGGYKKNYAMLQEIRTADPEMGGIIDKLDTHIKELDNTLLKTPDTTTTRPTFVKERLQKAGIQTGEPTNQLPVGEGKLRDSAAFKRLVEHLQDKSPEELKQMGETDLKYHQMKIKDQAEKAFEFVEKNPQKAYRVAKGFENPPEGVNQHAVNMALADQAFAEKNYALAADLHKSGSLHLTRLGQEIVMERGRYSDVSPHAFMRQLIKTRLERLGGFTDTIKQGGAAVENKMKSAKARAIDKIDKATEKLQKEFKKQQTKIQSAQNLLDQLTCK